MTDFVGIQPSKIWLTGEEISHSTLKRKNCGWVIISEESEADNLETLLINVVNKIKPSKNLLKNYIDKRKLNSELACILALKEATPSININPKFVQFFSELGSSFDIDIYLVE